MHRASQSPVSFSFSTGNRAIPLFPVVAAYPSITRITRIAGCRILSIVKRNLPHPWPSNLAITVPLPHAIGKLRKLKDTVNTKDWKVCGGILFPPSKTQAGDIQSIPY